MIAQRPQPPAALLEDPFSATFLPGHELGAWLRAAFIDEDGPIANPDHHHLQCAQLGVLWTNVANARGGRAIVGQCELGRPQAMGTWSKARAEQQVRQWFGEIPHFILTFDVRYAAQCDDASFCALVEHELYHAGQERDAFGAPKFRRDGTPAFAIRGHDVEEFVGVVARYGHAAAGVSDLVAVAARPPSVSRASIAGACGVCLRKAA